MIGSQARSRPLSAVSPRKTSFLKQRKFLIGGALVVLAIAYLVYSSLQGSTVYYMTPTEVKNQAQSLEGQVIRVGGTVVDGPVNFDGKNMILKFEVTDNTTTFPVVYKGVVPDAFKPGVDVVIEGKYTAAGVFEATSLLAKCPSKYVPEL
ncbi:MAG: cytochrome c maturation protein CcmE [Chloroflexi bacterium]|nr:cytochrome c maturation protein CcmE [Chloroflexota bacterium]MDA8187164.1 cytochrome c maturation protein CcmE [Dehalococcoidales bacterium]